MRFRKTHRTILALSLAAFGAVAAASADEGVRLRLDLQPGQTFRYAMTQDQDMKMALGALGQQDTRSRTRFEFSYAIQDVAGDGSVKIRTTYDRIKSDIEAAGNRMSFDTAADDQGEGTNPMASFQRLLLGKTLVLTLSPRGEILAIDGFDEIWKAMEGEIPDDPMARQAMELMKAGFGEESMKSMMQVGLAVFPEEPVAPGGSWDHDMTIDNPLLGRMTIASRYESLGRERRAERDCLKLGASTNIEFAGGSPMIEQLAQMLSGGNAEVGWEMGDSSGEGSVWVDVQSGLTVESEQTQTMKMKMSIAGGQDPATTMDIDMDIRQSTRLELIE